MYPDTKVIDLWQFVMEQRFIPEPLAEAIRQSESDQSGQSSEDDWTAREYRKIG